MCLRAPVLPLYLYIWAAPLAVTVLWALVATTTTSQSSFFGSFGAKQKNLLSSTVRRLLVRVWIFCFGSWTHNFVDRNAPEPHTPHSVFVRAAQPLLAVEGQSTNTQVKKSGNNAANRFPPPFFPRSSLPSSTKKSIATDGSSGDRTAAANNPRR